MTMTTPVRMPGFVMLDGEAELSGGWRSWRGRGKTFLVEWVQAQDGAASLQRACEDEVIAVFPASGGEIVWSGKTQTVPPRAVAIVPAGAFTVAASPGAPVILLSPIRSVHLDVRTLNDADYGDGDDGIRLVGPAAARADAGGVQVVEVDRIVPPADKPRLKMVRSATMSINWIEYEGVRDRSKLSPHDHDDFEQGSLAIEGSFIHHLRVPWGPDANAWRDDMHLEAPARSLCVIPPRMIHTTEGLGDGKHVLIDIFAPARADFIAKGWMSNAAAYRD